MYEPRRARPIPVGHFLGRMVRHAAAAIALILGSLAIGVWGYHHFEALPWLDAFLNASMILGGMGPVNPIGTDAGKLFAGTYALYSGLVFIAVAGLVLTPAVHRVLHTFHWEE